MSRLLFLAGALPFLLLGLGHTRATPLLPGQGKGLSTRDPEIEEQMRAARLRLT